MIRIGLVEIENVTKEYSNNWFHILPLISIQHKYWYLWSINIGWLSFDFMIEVSRADWIDLEDIKDTEIYIRKPGSDVQKVTLEEASKITKTNPYVLYSMCSNEKVTNLKTGWQVSEYDLEKI